MPEGPFGFPRLSTVGPFSRKTIEEIKEAWTDCPPSDPERFICNRVKFHTLEEFESRGVTTDLKFAYDVHSGCCDEIAEGVYIDSVEEGIEGMMIAVGWGPDGSGHTWIIHNGKHYDATDPQGVDDPHKLWFWDDYDTWRVDEGDSMRTFQPDIG